MLPKNFQVLFLNFLCVLLEKCYDSLLSELFLATLDADMYSGKGFVGKHWWVGSTPPPSRVDQSVSTEGWI